MQAAADSQEHERLQQLIAAEERALEMLAAIEAAGFVQPGRRESDVDADIAALAEREFGVTRHWHKRLVRTGANTLCVFADTPDERTIGENDTIYLDLGPVFEANSSEAWEADIGQTYAIGNDPAHHALIAALPEVFEATRAHANANPNITGAELYALACSAAQQRGYIFGGKIAGHTVGEFPHLTWPGEREHTRIYPDNPNKLSDPDHLGRKRFWIIETHLIAADRSFGGFYERLLRP
ncbi:MAG: M24 family metallopeptidase [Terricaulis sp.]